MIQTKKLSAYEYNDEIIDLLIEHMKLQHRERDVKRVKEKLEQIGYYELHMVERELHIDEAFRRIEKTL